VTEEHQPTDLAALLREEVQAAQALMDRLQEEADALRGTDPAAIEASARNKLAATEGLAACTARRETWLAQRVTEQGPSGLAEAIRRAPPEARPALHRLRADLRQAARRIAHHNQANGAILQARQQYARRALDLLCGRPSPETATYGRSGHTDTERPRQSLARA
jgi:flagellar biosynthesis/type III secretory pathway chaperone